MSTIPASLFVQVTPSVLPAGGAAVDANLVVMTEDTRVPIDAVYSFASAAAVAAFFGVRSGLGQVKALEAAERSSLTALEANRLGYQVGVRINIDVLNADNQVYVTRRDLAKAVLDTLMSQLRLKAAVGTLSEEDVAPAPALAPAVTVTPKGKDEVEITLLGRKAGHAVPTGDAFRVVIGKGVHTRYLR